MLIKWTNKLSGEQGFVRNIRIFRGYFENTFNIEEAHVFANAHQCDAAIKLLDQFGETSKNSFELV